MKGETHTTGGFLVKHKLRLPMSVLYLTIKPSLPHALGVYLLYDALTVRPALLGALLPDYDHHTYDVTPHEIQEPFGEMYFKLLKKWGATHRSAHTHNIDLWTLGLGIPALLMLGNFILTQQDLWFLLSVRTFMLLFGVLSHQYLDTLTVSGVTPSYIKVRLNHGRFKTKEQYRRYQSEQAWRVVPIGRKMYRMQPIFFGKFKTPFARPVALKFSQEDWGKTGGEGGWEDHVRYMMVGEIMKTTHWKRRLYEVIAIVLIYNAIMA